MSVFKNAKTSDTSMTFMIQLARRIRQGYLGVLGRTREICGLSGILWTQTAGSLLDCGIQEPSHDKDAKVSRSCLDVSFTVLGTTNPFNQEILNSQRIVV